MPDEEIVEEKKNPPTNKEEKASAGGESTFIKCDNPTCPYEAPNTEGLSVVEKPCPKCGGHMVIKEKIITAEEEVYDMSKVKLSEEKDEEKDEEKAEQKGFAEAAKAYAKEELLKIFKCAGLSKNKKKWKAIMKNMRKKK